MCLSKTGINFGRRYGNQSFQSAAQGFIEIFEEVYLEGGVGHNVPPLVGKGLRQDPLEAILVIFGRRALIFFSFESSWKKMKNDTTFVRMRSGDHLGDAKMSKRAPRSIEFNFFNNCDRHKRFSQIERRRADLQNPASDFLIFALELSYDLSKFRDDFTPFFSNLKDHN